MEGQSIMKKDGYYYIYYSGGNCCGTRCSYQVEIARSKSFYGPYEYFDQNPVLSQNNNWKCMGHGTFVDVSSDQTYYLHHAYNKSSNVATGRQGIISRLIWPSKKQWPKFLPQEITDTSRMDIYDKFNSVSVNNYWQWDFRHSSPIFKQANNVLTLGGSVVKNNLTGIVLTIRPVAASFTMQVTVLNRNNSLKGLTFYGDVHSAMGFGVQGDQIMVWKVVDKKLFTLIEKKITRNEPIQLSLNVNADQRLQFKYKQGDMNWKEITLDIDLKGMSLEQWDRSPRPGLHYRGNTKEDAQFSNFSLTYERK